MKCFVAGNMILTAAGLVAIENIKAGDRVISTNTDTFERAEKTVLETYIRETNELVHLTINGELIQTTHDHPFYVKGTGFVNAKDLYAGDRLLNADGRVLTVENITFETAEAPVKVYNFQVEDFHTYHVGENGVLVHNADYNKQQLLEAGNQQDKGELTKAGRALDKHGNRAGSKFEKACGNDVAKNLQGNKVLDSILSDPEASAIVRHHARFGDILEIRTPDGIGARFSADGTVFIGFIEG